MGENKHERGTSQSSETLESNQPVHQGKAPERVFDSRSRVKTVLLAGGLSVAAFYLTHNRFNVQDSPNEAVSTWLQPDPVKPEQVEKFDLRTYQPPKAGRIWKTHFSESSDKSIVYIPDIHKLKNNSEDWPVQEQIFVIIEDAIQKYGKVPVVIENWTDYFDEPEDNFRRNIKEERLTTIASEPDIGKRKKMILEHIQQGRGSAGSSLAAVYQDEIEPVANQTEVEFQQDFHKRMLNQFLINVRNQNEPCSAIGVPEARMGIDSALDQEATEAMPPELIACQCTYLVILLNSVRDLSLSRRKRSAVSEIRRGVAHKSPFVFVIAGTAHVTAAMKEMEERNVSYVVVAPHSNDMNYAQKDEMPDISYCEQWATDHKEEFEKDRQALREAIARRASEFGY